MLFTLEIGMLAAFITLFLNYCIGKPGGEFSPYEIFSGYTVWLSKRRLRQVGLYAAYWNQCVESAQRAKSKHELITLKNDMARIYYNAADPFFTWERAIGMCPVCTGFWISLGLAFLESWNIFQIIQIIVISHITIRILNKIL